MTTAMKKSAAPAEKSRLGRSARTMIAITMLISLLAISVTTALANRDGKRGPDPERMLARLASELNLSAEQQNEVAPILEAEQQRRREIMARVRDQDAKKLEEARGAMTEIDEETAAQLATVLAPVQLQRFQEMREEQRQLREERRANREEERGHRPRNR